MLDTITGCFKVARHCADVEKIHTEYLEWRSQDRCRESWSFYEWLTTFASNTTRS